MYISVEMDLMTHASVSSFCVFHLPSNVVSSPHAHLSNSVHSFGDDWDAAVGVLVCVHKHQAPVLGGHNRCAKSSGTDQQHTRPSLWTLMRGLILCLQVLENNLQQDV